MVREGFSGGTRAAFLSYWKALLIRFCVIIRSCLMLMLLIRSFAILISSIFWANYVLLKLGVYTRTLKKHQVVRDLKKFENHWSKRSTVAIGKLEQQVSKASHCGSKQQQRSPDEINLLLLVCATYTVYGRYSSRTSRSWWIAHSTQRQRRGCSTTYVLSIPLQVDIINGKISK